MEANLGYRREIPIYACLGEIFPKSRYACFPDIIIPVRKTMLNTPVVRYPFRYTYEPPASTSSTVQLEFSASRDATSVPLVPPDYEMSLTNSWVF